jgi:hypothetical protein
VAEWFKAAVLKTARGFTLPRGFESHPFRQPTLKLLDFPPGAAYYPQLCLTAARPCARRARGLQVPGWLKKPPPNKPDPHKEIMTSRIWVQPPVPGSSSGTRANHRHGRSELCRAEGRQGQPQLSELGRGRSWLTGVLSRGVGEGGLGGSPMGGPPGVIPSSL